MNEKGYLENKNSWKENENLQRMGGESLRRAEGCADTC